MTPGWKSPRHTPVPRAERLWMLMYHEVALPEHLDALSSRTQRNYVLDTTQFAQHLAVLQELRMRTVSMDQVSAWLRGRATLPERAVCISFDDGFSGNARNALPMLVNCGYAATFFIATGLVAKPQMMHWTEIQRLVHAGMWLGSHTVTHRLLSRLNREQTAAELVGSKSELEKRCGNEIRHLSLPFGDSNQWLEEIALESGYETACSSNFGDIALGANPLCLQRVAMTSSITADRLRRMLLGDEWYIAAQRIRSEAKRRIAWFIGKRNYDRLVNFYYGVDNGIGDWDP